MILTKLFNDYSWGGVLFTVWYIFCTLLFPTIYMLYTGQFGKMNNVSFFIWNFILLVWQMMIVYSIYKNLVNDLDNDDYDKVTYDLFVKGGWSNFQKWMAYFAQDIWNDMILLSLIFIMPLGIFDKVEGLTKIQLIFTKIGLFYVFLFFVLTIAA